MPAGSNDKKEGWDGRGVKKEEPLWSAAFPGTAERLWMLFRLAMSVILLILAFKKGHMKTVEVVKTVKNRSRKEKTVRAWIFCFIWFIQKRWINPKYRSAWKMINLHPDWWHILWCFVGSLKSGVGSAPFVNLQCKMMQNCYGKQLNEPNWTNWKCLEIVLEQPTWSTAQVWANAQRETGMALFLYNFHEPFVLGRSISEFWSKTVTHVINKKCVSSECRDTGIPHHAQKF